MHRASRAEKGNRAEEAWIETCPRVGHSMAVVGAGIAPRGRRLSPGPSGLYACQTGHLSMAPPSLPPLPLLLSQPTSSSYCGSCRGLGGGMQDLHPAGG